MLGNHWVVSHPKSPIICTECQAGTQWVPFYSLWDDSFGDQTHNVPVSGLTLDKKATELVEVATPHLPLDRGRCAVDKGKHIAVAGVVEGIWKGTLKDFT